MTIGERIALKRKERSLSQEALGESLGVTRQSISKWEGDVTLPEIDKLIAMSRLFGVSVGWLLGEERQESAPEEDDREPESAPPPPEELSEEQLRMVEEIVQRYITAQPRPLSKRQRQRLKLAAALVVLCFAAGFFSLSNQIRRVKEDNQDLRQAIDSVNYSVGSQIDGITGQINSITSRVAEVLQDQNNLFAGYGVEKVARDLRGNTVTFRASAVPKVYEPGMWVTFLADNGRDVVASEGAAAAERSFEAPITCILSDEISVYAVLHRPDGTEESQLLTQFYNLYSETVPEFVLREEGPGLGDVVLSDGVLTVPEQIVAAIPGSAAAGPAAKVKAVQVGLFKDQHLVEWCEPTEVPEGYRTGGFEDFVFFRMRERSVAFASGSEVCYALVVTDEYDRVTVRCGELYNDESFRAGGQGPVPVQESVPAEWYQYGTMEEWGLTREFLERSPGHRF